MQSYAASSAQDLIAISTDCVGDTVVVTVDGEVDILAGPPFRRSLAEAVDKHDGRRVVVDLSGVTLLGSTGLAVLVDAHWHAQQRGRDLVLVVVPDTRAVPLALQMAGLATLFTVRADLQEALRSGG